MSYSTQNTEDMNISEKKKKFLESDHPNVFIHSMHAKLKLLLHPIVSAYTRKCAANIVEKYECSLAVG